MNEGSEKRKNMNIRFKLLATALAACLASGYTAAQTIQIASNVQANETSSDAKLINAAATSYENGEGVPRDYSKALELYCKAANMGNRDAQFAIGWMYANARGVERDDAVARQMFAMAAAQGHEQAATMLRYTQSSVGAHLPPCLVPAPDAPIATTTASIASSHAQGPNFKRVQGIVDKLAPNYEVDPKLVLAIIEVESGFNATAKSPKNAQGLMQLIPETAQRFHVKNIYDEEDNIRGGMAYLQWLLAYYKGNVRLVAAAYNAGEKAVETHRGVPPFPETMDYVKKVSAIYKKTLHPYNRDLLAVSSTIP
jgi:soluble lytic murein transglycosylase-like protein